MNLFPIHSLWLLPSGSIVRIVSFSVNTGVTCSYPDEGRAVFNPNWLYRVGKRIGA